MFTEATEKMKIKILISVHNKQKPKQTRNLWSQESEFLSLIHHSQLAITKTIFTCLKFVQNHFLKIFPWKGLYNILNVNKESVN